MPTHDDRTVNLNLSGLKEELAREFGKAVALYFSPVAAVVDAIRRNFGEVEKQARGAPMQGHLDVEILKKDQTDREHKITSPE